MRKYHTDHVTPRGKTSAFYTLFIVLKICFVVLAKCYGMAVNEILFQINNFCENIRKLKIPPTAKKGPQESEWKDPLHRLLTQYEVTSPVSRKQPSPTLEVDAGPLQTATPENVAYRLEAKSRDYFELLSRQLDPSNRKQSDEIMAMGAIVNLCIPDAPDKLTPIIGLRDSTPNLQSRATVQTENTHTDVEGHRQKKSRCHR